MAEVRVDLDEFIGDITKALGAQPPAAETETATEPVEKSAPAPEAEAPAEDPLAEIRKAVADNTENIAKLLALFDSETGPVTKALKEVKADADAAKTAASAALDFATGSTAVRKSQDGQEGAEPVQKSASQHTDDFMRDLYRNPGKSAILR